MKKQWTPQARIEPRNLSHMTLELTAMWLEWKKLADELNGPPYRSIRTQRLAEAIQEAVAEAQKGEF